MDDKKQEKLIKKGKNKMRGEKQKSAARKSKTVKDAKSGQSRTLWKLKTKSFSKAS